MKGLFIYNEGTDPASNTYLNMIKKTAEEKGDVDVIVLPTLDEIKSTIVENKYELKDCGLLVMQPYHNIEEMDIRKFMADMMEYENYSKECQSIYLDIDGVLSNSVYDPATAVGIYNHITEMLEDRAGIIGVIGRGVVGSCLIDKLIKYGYTVVEINSKTSIKRRNQLLKACDIIVGLSTSDGILTEEDRKELQYQTFIDAGKNFDFADRSSVLKCGKWTREEIISRLFR